MFSLENCTEEYKKLYEMYNKAESILNNIDFIKKIFNLFE